MNGASSKEEEPDAADQDAEQDWKRERDGFRSGRGRKASFWARSEGFVNW